MADKSKIEWTDATWNPVSGCTKVSPGCKNCYAKRVWPRLSAPGMPYAGRVFEDVTFHPDRLEAPLRWKKPRRIFVNSMSDLFHENVSFGFIDQVLSTIRNAPQHIFQILTKRPRRMLEYFHDSEYGFEYIPPPNLWLGVSVENQATADDRIPLLLDVPAFIRFLSVEPMLEPIEIKFKYGYDQYGPNIDWVIVGGESGPGARPLEPDWVRRLMWQCIDDFNIPFFFKQGSAANWSRYKDFDSFPPDLQVREYPR